MATTSNPQKCKDKNRRGDPCGAWACEGSDLCFWHDPKKAKQRRRARRAGGQARHGRRIGTTGQADDPVIIEDVADVVALLSQAVKDTLSLEKSLQRCRTVGYLAGVILKGLEVGDIEERVAELERRLAARQ